MDRETNNSSDSAEESDTKKNTSERRSRKKGKIMDEEIDELLNSEEETNTKVITPEEKSRKEREIRRAKSLAPKEDHDNFKERSNRAKSVFSRPEANHHKKAQPIEKERKKIEELLKNKKKDSQLDIEKKKIERMILEMAKNQDRVDQEVEQLKEIRKLILQHPHCQYNSLSYRLKQIDLAIIKASKLSINYQCFNIDSTQHKENEVIVTGIDYWFSYLKDTVL